MGRKISKSDIDGEYHPIEMEEGWLYYVGKDGYVWAAPMKHYKRKNPRARKKKVSRFKVIKRPGKMYYIKNGNVYEAELKNYRG